MENSHMKLDVKVRECIPGTYEARCPILPGCRGMGSTSDEAMADFIRAARGYFASVNNFVPTSLDKGHIRLCEVC